MSPSYDDLSKSERKIPSDIPRPVIDTIKRIENNPFVLGVMFFRHGFAEMCTVPLNMIQPLTVELPHLTELIKKALREIDVLDELKGYRIETKCSEIAMVVDKDISTCAVVKLTRKETGRSTNSMKIISNLLKDSKDEWLVRTTASINNVNPIVDRIMKDESVEGVIMTNKEGAPILTNVNLTAATNYGAALRRLGFLTQICVTEVDPLDEVLILRVKTKKLEMMVAPHREFDIIVVQHARHKLKQKKD